MSIMFNWVKNPRIEVNCMSMGICEYTEYTLEGDDKDCVDFSSGNIEEINDLILKYSGLEIPWLDDCQLSTEYIKDLMLINPNKMYQGLNEVLSHKEDERVVYWTDRLSWMKELSSQGYYFYYDRYC